jgi:hypothetical protein
VITHELKIWRAYFVEIARGAKTLEIRFGDDRQYAAEDTIVFREWEHGAAVYTGRWLTARIAACQRTEQARFVGFGQPVWALALTEVGDIQEGVPSCMVPSRIDLYLAPEGTTTFDAWEAWPTRIPMRAVHIEEETATARTPISGSAWNRSITLCRIPRGDMDAAMLAWVKMSEYAVYKGRMCVLWLQRGAVEGPQEVRIISLFNACVVRAKHGDAVDLFSEVDIVGVVPDEVAE